MELAMATTDRDALRVQVQSLLTALRSEGAGGSAQHAVDAEHGREVAALRAALKNAESAREAALGAAQRSVAQVETETRALREQLATSEAALTAARNAGRDVAMVLESDNAELQARVAALESTLQQREQEEGDNGLEVAAIVKAFQEMSSAGDKDVVRLRAENDALRRELRAVDSELMGAIDSSGSPALKKSTARAVARALKSRQGGGLREVAPETRSRLAAHAMGTNK
jgi:hypothetical protein